MKDKNFKENELIIYAPKDAEGNIYKMQIGKFKRYNEITSTAFVYFHSGGTAAGCKLDDLYHLEGKEYIKDEFNSLDKKEYIEDIINDLNKIF